MRLLIEKRGGESHVVLVDRPRFVIGRDPACDLTLDDGEVSRQHAALTVVPGGRVELRDLGSRNGTFVDGCRLTGSIVLKGGEIVRVGQTKFGIQPDPTEGRRVDEPKPTPSAIQRLVLRKSARRATVLATAAILVAVTVAALFATGVIKTSGGKEPSVADVVKEVGPSVALVKALVDGKPNGTGSGWVLDSAKGLIVTNAHVVNSGSTFQVGVGGRMAPARVLGVAPCEDLAVLEISGGRGLKTLPMGSQSKLAQGETVVAIGYPTNASLSDNLTSTSGVVSVVKERFQYPSLDLPIFTNVIQTDTAINPGNSGGPLVDLEGELVGVNTAGLVAVGDQPIQGQGYAIGVDQVKRVVSQLRAGKSIHWTGADFEFPTAEKLAEEGVPPGLVVVHAVKGSPAERAGLGEEPVLVTAIAGKPVDNTLRSYCDAVRGVSSGETVAFRLFAGEGESAEVDVEIL